LRCRTPQPAAQGRGDSCAWRMAETAMAMQGAGKSAQIHFLFFTSLFLLKIDLKM
jgi:hypothetical protein